MLPIQLPFARSARSRRYLYAGWVWLLSSWLLFFASPANLEANELPTLGHASSYDISLHQERHLGQGWLRQFRTQAPIYYDPLVQDYTENLVRRLAASTRGLETRDLDILIVNQRQLNAFAVPGGVIGVNTGLFTFATHEDELASVMAHELAHISQRHFARRVEAARGAQWSTMAGLLAGILVASQGHADAGIAAIAGTQAAAIQTQLAWSRSYEQEADRIGMETLAAAGYAPEAMPAMFQQMQRLASLRGRPPEFLMTHPLTESRIADAWARADQLPSAPRVKGRDYELIRARLIFHHEADPQTAERVFLQQEPSQAGRLYVQALKAQQQEAWPQAQQVLKELLDEYPDWLALHFLLAEAYLAADDFAAAKQVLEAILALVPRYYPARFLLADLYVQQEQWSTARREWRQLTQQRPKDPELWFQLAEASGKAGFVVEVHQARAEYFQLTGRFRQALNQLDLAIQRAADSQESWQLREVLRERRRELEEQRELMDL